MGGYPLPHLPHSKEQCVRTCGRDPASGSGPPVRSTPSSRCHARSGAHLLHKMNTLFASGVPLLTGWVVVPSNRPLSSMIQRYRRRYFLNRHSRRTDRQTERQTHLRHKTIAFLDSLLERGDLGRGAGAKAHVELSSHEARALQRAVPDQGEDLAEPAPCGAGGSARPSAHETGQHASGGGGRGAGERRRSVCWVVSLNSVATIS